MEVGYELEFVERVRALDLSLNTLSIHSTTVLRTVHICRRHGLTGTKYLDRRSHLHSTSYRIFSGT